ncbi:hypothetical protein niasHT_034778 [Heterodera trifolii]|uniref:RBR-type E3 ubiquitin transferase n=1 Tax=Heterodera trifolii TaxID=157864 RepID=A0ABD2HUV6_9BILA
MEPKAYKILTAEEFLKETQKLTQLTAEKMGISEALSKLMLNIFNWNQEMLIEEFDAAKDKGAFFEAKKVAPERPKTPADDDECLVCLGSECKQFCKMSSCGHYICVGAWSHHFWKEMNLKQTVILPCIGCEHFVDEEFIIQTFEEFCGTKDQNYIGEYLELGANQRRLVPRFKELALKTLVQRNPLLKSCPDSKCSKIIKVNKAEPCIVMCACKRAFCFACTKGVHSPISCSFLSKWEIESIDPETKKTLAKVAKPCPNCGEGIQKTDGCIEMECPHSNCKYVFCWICLKAWNTHTSNLGGMCESDEVNAQKRSRSATEENRIKKRFEHFHALYTQQNTALEAEKELHGKLEEQINGSKKQRPTKDEIYLMGAFELLFDARTTLKYSFVYAFYHFEDEDLSLKQLQVSLEKTADELREYFDKLELKTEKIEENKPKVEKMCQNLEADIEKLVKFCDGKSAEESRTRKKATEAGTSGGTGEGHSGGKTEEKGADKIFDSENIAFFSSSDFFLRIWSKLKLLSSRRAQKIAKGGRLATISFHFCREEMPKRKALANDVARNGPGTHKRRAGGMREKSRQMNKHERTEGGTDAVHRFQSVHSLLDALFLFTPLIPLCGNEQCFADIETVFSIFTLAGHLNSMLNPLMYSRFSRDFRKTPLVGWLKPWMLPSEPKIFSAPPEIFGVPVPEPYKEEMVYGCSRMIAPTAPVRCPSIALPPKSNHCRAVNLTIVRFRSSTLSIKIFETENFQVHSFRQRPLAKIEAGISPTLPISVVSRTQSLTVLLSTKQTPFSSGHFDSVLPGSAVYELQFAEAQSPCACPASPLVVSRSRTVFTTSPGFPTEYCDSANCSMTVALEGPAQRDGGGAVEVLRMRIWHFQTEPDQDYVAVWDEDGRRKLFLSNEAVEIRHLTFDRPHFAFTWRRTEKKGGAFIRLCPALCWTDVPITRRTVLTGESANSWKHIEAPKSSDVYHCIVFKLNHTIARPSDFILISQGPQRERNPFKRKFGSMSAGIEVTTEFEGVEPITLWLHWEPSKTEDNDQRTAADEDGGGGSGPAVLVNFSYEWREGTE